MDPNGYRALARLLKGGSGVTRKTCLEETYLGRAENLTGAVGLVGVDADGQPITGFTHETIAAALHAAGIRTLGHSPHLHRPRGLFCAIGNCSSCFMTVDGEPNVRVCVTRVKAGMKVEEQHGKGVVL